MNQNKSLTLNGLSVQHMIYLIFVIAGVGVTLYLTKYYFDSHYPESLAGAASFCDISSFWNCDAATFSPFSNIAGVPIAFFGLITNLIFLMGSIFPSPEMEKTSSFISKINLIGCLVLFVYSVVVLGSLCPMCTLYYVISAVIFYLFYSNGSNSLLPDWKILGLWTILGLIGSGIVYKYNITKDEKQVAVNKQIIQQFFTLPNLGKPDVISPFILASSTEKFEDAPIRISIFSDFQCPFCKVLSEQFHKLERLYEGKINVYYYFFPLDSECNDQVKRQIHPHACRAAYLSACDKNKFKQAHDMIFDGQEKLSDEWLMSAQKDLGLSGCFENEEVKKSVKSLIAQAKIFNLRSTPTLIINGVKIEGTLKIKQYMALFDEIIKRQQEKK